MSEDFRDNIKHDPNATILRPGDPFYHKDSALIAKIKSEMAAGKSFMASRNFKHGPENAHCLIASKGGALYFEEGMYMFEDNPVPQFVSPVRFNN